MRMYSSVMQFYVDLVKMLFDSGMTVSRTVEENTDLVLDTGGGKYARVRRELVNPNVAAIGIHYGTDPDVLASATLDSELCFPFTVSSGEFLANCTWTDNRRTLSVFIIPGSNTEKPSGDSRRYVASFSFEDQKSYVFHRDHLNHQYEPNFKITGGPYIPSGA